MLNNTGQQIDVSSEEEVLETNNEIDESAEKIINYIQDIINKQKKEEINELSDKNLIEIRTKLLEEHNISDYYELNSVNIRTFDILINSIPKLKEYIKINFEITDLRNFRVKQREELWLIIYPSTDLVGDIRVWLDKIWITDQKSLVEFVYITWSCTKIKDILCKTQKQTRQLLTNNNIDSWHFINDNIDTLSWLLWWDITMDMSREWLIKNIKCYEIMSEVEYIEDLILVYSKISKESHIEFFIYLAKVMWIRSIPNGDELRIDGLNLLLKIWTSLWLRELDRDEILEDIWNKILDDMPRVPSNTQKRWRILSKYFMNNTMLVLKIREVKLLLLSELWIHNTSRITTNEITWFSNFLKKS